MRCRMRVLRSFRWLPTASLVAALGSAPFTMWAAPADRTPADRATAKSAVTHLSHGRFADLLAYRPVGTPSSVALLIWDADRSSTDAAARQLVQQGALVVSIDWRAFKTNLEADGDECVSPDGDLENLSHFVQAFFHTPTYLTPILVGRSSGAAMAYAMLAQAPRNTFAAALTLGFCPSLGLAKPLCKGSGFEAVRSPHRTLGVDFLARRSLDNPWVDLQAPDGEACPASAALTFISHVQGAAAVALPNAGHGFASLPGWVPSFTAAYVKLAAQNPALHAAPPPAGLADLPIVEVPAATTDGTASPNVFAIIMSGDGGWAGLDQDVAGALSAKGIPVVGLDSLRYYWSARTPEGLAADTDRMIRYYLAHFGKQRVLLIGYSQGADVLPFAVNRLPEATRALVALTAVMGMSEHALFEFHLSSWISDSNSGPATLPEIDRITGMPVLCIYGADESGSLCPKLDPKKFNIVKLNGGHHFDGDYANLARQILAAAKP